MIIFSRLLNLILSAAAFLMLLSYGKTAPQLNFSNSKQLGIAENSFKYYNLTFGVFLLSLPELSIR